jgi:hypothetical protein
MEGWRRDGRIEDEQEKNGGGMGKHGGEMEEGGRREGKEKEVGG